MIGFFMQGGYMMWWLLIISIAILVLTIKNAVAIFQATGSQLQKIGDQLFAIFFWGIIAMVLGFFAHYHGIYEAMKAIMAASDISPAIVAEGYKFALTTILSGMFIFVWSGIFWFSLRWWWQRKMAL